MQQDEILTGEGVLLDARPVSFAVRVLSGLIDAVVYLTVGYGVAMLLLVASASLQDDGLAAALSVLGLATLMVIAPTTIETLSRGRSLGKLALGVRIVRDDGGPVRFRHAFVRALTGVGELWLTAAAVAIITSIVHPRSEEHTSELQSRPHLVCRLLLEKKKSTYGSSRRLIPNWSNVSRKG